MDYQGYFSASFQNSQLAIDLYSSFIRGAGTFIKILSILLIQKS